MEERDLQARLEWAVDEVVKEDSFLLEYNLSERCIASRLAMRSQFNYRYGALIECETREGRKPTMWISEWFAPDRSQ